MMKKSKMNLFMATATAAVLVATVAAPVQTEAAKKFSDVSPKSDYYDIIHTMAGKGIISGYENGTFKPNEKISRKHAAALLARAYPADKAYSAKVSDVGKDNAYYANINYVVAKGWLDAPNGKFEPNKNITRGDMALALTRAAGLTDKSKPHGMKDVSSKYNDAVRILYTTGVTTGFTDKTFREKEGLSRAHYAVFMFRAMNYTEKLTSENKGTVYGDSVFGKHTAGKIPNPKGIKLDDQNAKQNKLKALMPKGSLGATLPGENKELFDSSMAHISKSSGVSVDELVKYLEESAKTGEFVFFKNSEGKKYYIGVQYSGSNIYVGEDHR